MSIAFLGYVLPFGQMSFWGATVIINLLSPFPSLIEFLCGTYSVYNPTLKRFFLFHFQFPFLISTFIIIHIFYHLLEIKCFFFITGLHFFHIFIGNFILFIYYWIFSFNICITIINKII